MIKEINIKYCEQNEKYDLIIDGRWLGKFYELNTLIKGLPRSIELAKNIEEKENV